jgi:hypothetical protein
MIGFYSLIQVVKTILTGWFWRLFRRIHENLTPRFKPAGARNLISKLLKNSEWKVLAEYASPALFDVISPLAAMNQISALGRSMIDRNKYKEILITLQSTLQRLEIPIVILPISDRPQDTSVQLNKDSDKWPRVLDLYFLQILSQKQAVLDFRPQSFRMTNDGATTQLVMGWNPASVCMVWQDDFIFPLRDMYRGFYHKDSKLFKNALQKLGLSSSEQILHSHFGQNQSSHKFKLQDFLSTFNQVFLAAKKSKSRIHPQFLPFGLSLAALYQSLEATDRSYDIETCFNTLDSRVPS